MEIRRIGKSDLNATVIGFGAWGISGDLNKVKHEEMISVIREAYNKGINFFDTAPIYGYEGSGPQGYGISEKLLGKALKNVRDKVIIATKFGILLDSNDKAVIRCKKDGIKKEIDDSLKRLQTDYIDLYQAHWPDPGTSAEEIFTTIEEIKKSGKIRYIGVCNYSVNLILESLKYCEIISSQNLYNIIQRNSEKFYSMDLTYQTEEEIIPFCDKNNIGFIPFSPFCQGLLTGQKLKLEDFVFDEKDFRKKNPELSGEKLQKNLNLVKKLLEVSKKIGKPLSQVVLNWLIMDKRVSTIIAGPTKISEVLDNIASTEWSLGDNYYMEINKLID